MKKKSPHHAAIDALLEHFAISMIIIGLRAIDHLDDLRDMIAFLRKTALTCAVAVICAIVTRLLLRCGSR